MNDAVNRFGYTGGSELIRLPGPYAPLQDEPQDPESVKNRKNTKTVLIPLIQSMKDYILRHHKRMILGELNRAVSAGLLPPPPGKSPAGTVLYSSNVSFGDMRFWRINTGISVSTISRLRRKEKDNYTVDQVLAICIGLNLPPVISSQMFKRAGITFRSTKQHRAYQLILDCLYMDSLEEVQSFLARQGCEPLKLKAS